jgi:formylglycine-generating enzyme required for sulfatase activity
MRAIPCLPIILIALTLDGCRPTDAPAKAGVEKELQAFAKRIEDNLIFVEGGEFLMGDFGLEHAPERLPYDRNKDSKPLHKVELSSYSISKFKITNAEYQIYLKHNALTARTPWEFDEADRTRINSRPDIPAHIDWFESENYCNWLSSITGLPFALPTEAQWEYAARSRGQFLMVATDNGTYKAEPRHLITEDYDPKGINISSYGNRVAFAKDQGWATGSSTPLPVDMFPPNPLGLYSMTDNGHEWVKDWYDPDYYKYSPLKDPQGPEAPVAKDAFGRYAKVVRGQSYPDPYWGGGANVFRRAMEPSGSFLESGEPVLSDKTARCVVNTSISITAPSDVLPASNNFKVRTN